MTTSTDSPIFSSQVNVQAVRDKWNDDPFFAPDSVVLGLDIGIEGIGIAVRRGQEWLYCQTLLVDLPESQALAERRAFRASRHARKNRRTRMRRLRELFAAHGLPWVDDDVMSRTDPFKLRYRAITGTLASREALSICIRSCVLRRGYDYFAMNDEEGMTGEMPWGAGYSLADAKQWLSSAYVDATLYEKLKEVTPMLTFKDKELDEKKVAEWYALLDERREKAATIGIEATLRDYATNKLNERKARGRNFPRAHVAEHLRTIIRRHAHLIERAEEFEAALFHPCDNKKRGDKERAIFHYNRKTPREATLHFARKVKQCPYCAWLELPSVRCDVAGNTDIRKWNLVDFLSCRTFELVQSKKPIGRHTLPAEAVQVLMQAIEADMKWGEAKKALTAALKAHSLTLAKSDWNNAQEAQLKDIVAPAAMRRRGRASMSAVAARAMVAGATAGGTDFEPAHMEQWKKESGLYTRRAEIDASGGIYPQVQALLGTLRKQKSGDSPTFATMGYLQRLFEGKLKDKLQGKTAPDYCVVECIKDPSLNTDQAKDREKKQKENRARREKLATAFGKTQNVSHADFLRMRLFTEQGGTPTTPAKCPFTGQELSPQSLFTAELQLAHLWPDSRGGLYMADNLVLTTREVNAAMQNMTPREASAAALPGWLGWQEMQRLTKTFRWGRDKAAIFAAESFPEFNNMTRTAQLARELRRLVAVWMGIAGGEFNKERSNRLGNPCGMYTAAARRCFTWPGYVKDRTDNTHHRFDAALMTCLPPSAMNDVLYGGIFRTAVNEKGNRELMCIEGLAVPDLHALKGAATVCPVHKLRGGSKTKSLGDSTFWSSKHGAMHQRTSLAPAKVKNARELHDILTRMGIPAKDIPSEKQLEKWLVSTQAATKADKSTTLPLLKLNNGTPVLNVWKFSKKGSMQNSPMGWSGIHYNEDQFKLLRKLSATNDRLEIWLGWNVEKNRWEYYKRLIPTSAVLAGLKRMGLPWRGRKNASSYLLEILEREKAKDLCSFACGVLPAGAVKVGQFRKGDSFLIDFKAKHETLDEAVKKGGCFSNNLCTIQTWGYVTAVDKRIEFKPLIFKELPVYNPGSVAVLAKLLALPESGATKAAELHLTPPI